MHLAGILCESSRESDFAARVGGDEFAILLPHTDLDGARTLAERIRRRVESSAWSRLPDPLHDVPQPPSRPAFSAIPLRVSAGMTEFQGDQDAAHFVAQAEQGGIRRQTVGKEPGHAVTLGPEDKMPVIRRRAYNQIRSGWTAGTSSRMSSRAR